MKVKVEAVLANLADRIGRIKNIDATPSSQVQEIIALAQNVDKIAIEIVQKKAIISEVMFITILLFATVGYMCYTGYDYGTMVTTICACMLTVNIGAYVKYALVHNKLQKVVFVLNERVTELERQDKELE